MAAATLTSPSRTAVAPAASSPGKTVAKVFKHELTEEEKLAQQVAFDLMHLLEGAAINPPSHRVALEEVDEVVMHHVSALRTSQALMWLVGMYQNALEVRTDVVRKLGCNSSVTYAGLLIQRVLTCTDDGDVSDAALVHMLLRIFAEARREIARVAPGRYLSEMLSQFDDEQVRNFFFHAFTSAHATHVEKGRLEEPKWDAGFVLLLALLEVPGAVQYLEGSDMWMLSPGLVLNGALVEQSSYLAAFMTLPLRRSIVQSSGRATAAVSNDVLKKRFAAIFEYQRRVLSHFLHSPLRPMNAHFPDDPAMDTPLLRLASVMLNANRARARMQFDQRTVSSEDFVFGFSASLLHLCFPPAPAGSTTSSPQRSPSPSALSDLFSGLSIQAVMRGLAGFDLSNETHISTAEHSSVLIREEDSEAVGAVSAIGTENSARVTASDLAPIRERLYCILLFALHIGVVPMVTLIKQVDDEVNRMAREIRDMRAAQVPREREAFGREARLNQMREFLRLWRVAFGDMGSLSSQFRFLSAHSDNVLDWVGVHADTEPRSMNELLNAVRVPREYTPLPQWIIEDTFHLLPFQLLEYPELLGGVAQLPHLFPLFFVFLADKRLASSPSMRTGVVDVVFELLISSRTGGSVGEVNSVRESRARYCSLLKAHPLTGPVLVPAMIEVLADSKHDEINQRYRIVTILLDLLREDRFLQVVLGLGKSGTIMTRLLNLVINDTTMMSQTTFDEAKRSMAFEAEASTATPERKEAIHVLLSEIIPRVRATSSLVVLFLMLIHLLARNGPALFLKLDMTDRMSVLLNTQLRYLFCAKDGVLLNDHGWWAGTSPLATRYGIVGKTWLVEIVRIELALASQPKYLTSLASDLMAFDPELFRVVGELATRHSLLPRAEIEALAALAKRAEVRRKRIMEAEEEMGEIPEEFEDALLATLMTDPVMLPGSKKVVDRTTILRRLLEDPQDPFTRTPLTEDMLIPMDELRERIEQFSAKYQD
jgi:hypothetical protein